MVLEKGRNRTDNVVARIARVGVARREDAVGCGSQRPRRRDAPPPAGRRDPRSRRCRCRGVLQQRNTRRRPSPTMCRPRSGRRSVRARPSTTGSTRSTSSSKGTEGPTPAFTPPTSMMSAPSSMSCSARFSARSSAKVAPLSRNESGVRLTMPMTSARSRDVETTRSDRKDESVTSSERRHLRRWRSR